MVKIKPKKKIFYPKKNKNMSNNKLKKTKNIILLIQIKIIITKNIKIIYLNIFQK